MNRIPLPDCIALYFPVLWIVFPCLESSRLHCIALYYLALYFPVLPAFPCLVSSLHCIVLYFPVLWITFPCLDCIVLYFLILWITSPCLESGLHYIVFHCIVFPCIARIPMPRLHCISLLLAVHCIYLQRCALNLPGMTLCIVNHCISLTFPYLLCEKALPCIEFCMWSVFVPCSKCTCIHVVVYLCCVVSVRVFMYLCICIFVHCTKCTLVFVYFCSVANVLVSFEISIFGL